MSLERLTISQHPTIDSIAPRHCFEVIGTVENARQWTPVRPRASLSVTSIFSTYALAAETNQHQPQQTVGYRSRTYVGHQGILYLFMTENPVSIFQHSSTSPASRGEMGKGLTFQCTDDIRDCYIDCSGCFAGTAVHASGSAPSIVCEDPPYGTQPP